MAFCDYCACQDCITGDNGGLYDLYHATTELGTNICDVCYRYEICQTFEERKGRGPCDEINCAHRPTLTSGWTKL